jgi:hypothetical protein
MKVGDLVRIKRPCHMTGNAVGLCVSHEWHKYSIKSKIWIVEILNPAQGTHRYLEEELELVSESR